jgi:2-amino-4-hydroxy-6-hydroxymethyldihydropteridine diphosphokinase
MMTEVFVGVGSNVERERRIPEGLALLREQFGSLHLSPVYESAAVGFQGRPFFNLVVGFATDLSPQALVATLHAIEQRCGREPDVPKFAPRPLDLDLLLYGELVLEEPNLHLPRPDILQYGFALKPLADLVPERRHPVIGYRYAALWAQFEGSGRDLREVQLPGRQEPEFSGSVR